MASVASFGGVYLCLVVGVQYELARTVEDIRCAFSRMLSKRPPISKETAQSCMTKPWLMGCSSKLELELKVCPLFDRLKLLRSSSILLYRVAKARTIV